MNSPSWTTHSAKKHTIHSPSCARYGSATTYTTPTYNINQATHLTAHALCRGASHQGHHTSVMARVKVSGLEFTSFGVSPYCCTALSSTRARASCASSPATTATLHRHCMSQARVSPALWCTMVVPALPPHRRQINTRLILAGSGYPTHGTI